VEIVSQDIARYAAEHTTPAPELFERIVEETHATLERPEMLTGTVAGRFLELLVYAAGARRVVEIGTYSGYSAISMAAALPPGGRIDTCEISEKHAAVARRYIEEAGYADRVTVHVGPAAETLERLEGPVDLVFIDADHANYRNYYEALLPRLGERGLIVFDHILWGGEVLDPGDDANVRALADLNDHLRSDPRVTCVLVTARDGITLVRRNG
jgi:caffeoyl-CoA O-methyltransferase